LGCRLPDDVIQRIFLELAVEFKIEIHGVDVEDGEIGTEEDAKEIFAVETLVLPRRVFCFPACHVFVAFEDDGDRVPGNGCFVIAHFAHEAAISVIDGARDDAEVAGGVIEGITIDMVDDLAFLAIGDLLVEGSHDEKGDGDMTGATIGIKIQIEVLIEGSVNLICLGCFFIRTDFDASFAAVGIEDRYLLAFDADVEDAPEDERRVDGGVALAHEPEA